LMKGDIRVESHPGEGTTFTFSVPHSIGLNS
jgi:signal transduction histidine kinase